MKFSRTDMRKNNLPRTIGIVLLVIGALTGLAALIMRDQISRHKRDLFSAHAFRRFAALGYLARMPASIDLVRTLRDFVARRSQSFCRWCLPRSVGCCRSCT